MKNLLLKARPMKRPLQFRLATLFLVSFLVAIAAGWYGSRVRAAAREDRAVELLARKGACVMLYEEGAYIQFGKTPAGLCGTGLKRVVGPSAPAVIFADSDMHLLGDIQRIRSIDFQLSQVSGTRITAFKQEYLNCYVTP
jgi:hypothetical protein